MASARPTVSADFAVDALSSSSSRRSVKELLRELRCVPSRRSVKFLAGPHARHFLAFDTAISREDRQRLFMQLFVFRSLLVDPTVLTSFQPVSYTPEELVEIRVVTDPRHPAYGQAGLYAKTSIPHNTIVTPYAGFIEVFATSCNSRTYTMGFGSIGDDYALDAEFVGNYGRFANDPRGVGTLQANLSAENRFNSRGESYTALVARRQIGAGEEILMSYGKAHRLSVTPWMTMQGEPLMRPRVGGCIPFPTFSTEESSTSPRDGEVSPPAPSSELQPSPSTTHRRIQDTQRLPSTWRRGGAATYSSVATTSSEEAGGIQREEDEEHGEETVPSAPTVPLAPRPSIANDLLWECTQCGMWSLCAASIADGPMLCSRCGNPKLSGARYVSLLSSPAVTQAALLREAGLPAISSENTVPNPVSPSACTVAPSPSATPQPNIASAFSSARTDWPMNIPFLPWQVWDAAVPLSVLTAHSRFETQEHLFLYQVDTGLEEDGKPTEETGGAIGNANDSSRRHNGRRRARLLADDADGDNTRRATWNRSFDATSSRGTATSAVIDETSSSEEEEKEEPDMEKGVHRGRENRIVSSPTTGGPAASRRNGGGRAKRSGELWVRQGDVEETSLEIFKRELRAVAPLFAPASNGCFITPLGFSSNSNSPAALQRASDKGDEGVPTLGGGGTGKVETTSSSLFSTSTPLRRYTDAPKRITTSPLALLLAGATLVDRLLLLRLDALQPPSWSTREISTSAHMAPHLCRRLQCMTQRLFTGKRFNAGDMVGHVGGLVRRCMDSRCRVSDSCLEIPLRYFLPSALRRLCRLPLSSHGAFAHATAADGMALGRGEGTALHQFCRFIGGLSLVVTNEFMYCPCLVDEGEDGENGENPNQNPSERSNAEVLEALAACNVALVLTQDALGCPFACAVATKNIDAFVPLLARAQ